MIYSANAGSSNSRRKSGLIILLISATVFSTAGLFTKGVTADAWTVIFWRGLFAAIFTTAYIGWCGKMIPEFRGMGWPGLFVAALGVSATAAFIPAFKLTSIANVSLIYASAPFLAAGIAWIWYRERIEFRVIMAALAAAFGVAVVVSGSLGKVNFVGDALALWMTLMLSTIVVIYRRHPQTPAAGPNVAASLLLLPIALLLINPLASPRQEILVLAAFGLLHAIASVTLSEGARRLPPSEAALISSLETPLAILWGWALLAERPAIASIIGGGLILLAVFGSQLPYLFRKNRRDP